MNLRSLHSIVFALFHKTPAMVFFLFLPVMNIGCGGGKIKGYLASRETEGGQFKFFKDNNLPQDMSSIVVNLKKVGEGDDPSGWPTEQKKSANPDGTFTFDDVEPGRYAIEIDSGEFGGEYAVDSTEFSLGDGQTVNLVLPIFTNIWIEGHHSQGNPVLEPESGRVFLAGGGVWWRPGGGIFMPDGREGSGITALDVDRLTAVVLRSDVMFKDGVLIPVLLPGNEALLVVGTDRVYRIDLALFADTTASRVMDYDDLAFRREHHDMVRFRLVPSVLRNHMREFGDAHRTYLSADGSVLYFTIDGTGNNGLPVGTMTLVIDTETLEVVRQIPSSCVGYNPHSDHLYFVDFSAAGVLIVDGATRMDLAFASLAGQGHFKGLAPVPGTSDFLVVTATQNNDDNWVAFISLFDEQGDQLQHERAKDYLGVSFDPEAGAPAFDESGEFFMLGSAAFRILAEGVFEHVKVRIPPGKRFLERIACNPHRMVDPVNRYELWYGCPERNRPMALISLDQDNIPVGVKAGGGRPLLDWRRGRMFFFTGLNVAIVHYADPTARLRPAWADMSDVGADFFEPGAFCTQTTACEGSQICLQNTDTSPTGQCRENERLPYLTYCGGLGRLPCDPGFTCQLSNPTNPDSLGICDGTPPLDFWNRGILCSDESPCPEGMTCNAGRCHPLSCLADDDCAPGQVCGSIPFLGRVCIQPGPLPDGALCFLSSECASGSCVVDVTSLGNDVRRFCRRPCWQDAGCAANERCATLHPPLEEVLRHFPHCFPQDRVSCGCDEVTLCEGGICNCCTVGMRYPKSTCTPGQPNCEDACLPPSVPMPSDLAFDRPCALPCRRNADCPWAADCFRGYCLISNNVSMGDVFRPCNNGAGCTQDESCASLSTGWPIAEYFCFTMDSCATPADCPLGQDCIGVCTNPCTKGSDCDAGKECVAGTNYGDNYHCLNTLCGCQGSLAGEAVCDIFNDQCVLQVPCSPSACEESAPVCNPANDSGHNNLACVCPACSWNTSCLASHLWEPGFTPSIPVNTCPPDFTCHTHSGNPIGFSCVCSGGSCQ